MTRLLLRGIAAALLVTASACGASDGRASPATELPEVSEPSLPPDVGDWLARYNENSGVGRGESARWVLATRAEAVPVISGAEIFDQSQVYVFELQGDLAWAHSCPFGASPSACASVGTHQVFTLDADRLQILDFGITGSPADLESLGIVGLVSL